MIHKIYTQQWIVLIVGLAFLIISIYTLFRGIKRDKIIAISVFLFCLLFYILDEVKIRSHNAKAQKYLGVHKLVKYNNSQDYSIQILPNKKYRVFSDTDTLADGSWELHVSDDTSTFLMLSGGIFGMDEYRIE